MSNSFKNSMYVDINAITAGRFGNTQEAIEALEAIKPMNYEEYDYDKDFIKETEFYQQIVRNLKYTKGLKFTEQDIQQYRKILEDLGCRSFSEWKELTQTQYPKGTPFDTLIEDGDNGAAVKWIEELRFGNFEKCRTEILRGKDERKGIEDNGLEGQSRANKWYNKSIAALKELTSKEIDEER